ncbi:hypothetical protein [Streptomyces sp. AC550_RSS872]|uniref:hypothetical protein n=1 Tax=Streptomyces sp. AC550_RSS872 TaxID=2823689 RepID=UPI001C268BA1|nr:hypothetical protein [Streptomyces sp. AC550_RSS872]
MSQKSAITRHELVFQAERGGTFAATWGQRHIRAEIQRFGPVDDWNLRFRFHIPAGADGPVTVQHALDCIRTLIERHVALRTRFRLDASGGVVEQIVDAGGRIGVDIVAEDDPERCEQALSAHWDASASRRFDLELDLPVRFILGVCGASAYMFGIVVSHVNLDGAGAQLLIEDLRRIVSGRTPEPVALDPIAAAAEESGALARARSERARDLMRPAILAAADNPLRTPRHAPAVPMVRGAHLSTDSFQSAHDYLGGRLGLFTSGAITMVAAATAMHRVLDASRAVFKIECGNRWTPATQAYVGHRSQPIYIAVAGDAADAVAEIRSVDRAIFAAARRSPYDPDVMQALIEQVGADSWISFNDLSSLADKSSPRTARPELADAFLRHDEDAHPTPLEYHDSRPIGAGPLRVQAMIHLGGRYVDRLSLSLEADDEYLNTEEISALLRETERTVIDLARADHAKAEALR